MSRQNVNVKVLRNKIAERKLLGAYDVNSSLQKFIDLSVARHSDKFAPSDTTALRKSVFANTDFGSGQLIYTIYGRPDGRNTWNDTISEFQDRPIRGSFWSERWANGGGREVLIREINRFRSS